jgi:hypothetical protein
MADVTPLRERLGQVLDRRSGTTRRAGAAFNTLATAMVVCTVLVAAIVPAAAVSGAAADAHRGHHRHHCLHEARGTSAASPLGADELHRGRERSTAIDGASH